MAYLNYRIKIEGNIVPNDMIAPKSYAFSKDTRVAGSYKNANGISDEDLFPTLQTHISFSIRERNLMDHLSIKWIFAKQNHLAVEYWDDYDCQYRTGIFKMKTPKISDRSVTDNNINYNTTPIQLEEY